MNGIPLAIIECKSPTLGDKWLEEAVRQVLRYQEVGPEFQGLGAPKLFETIQLVIGTCGQAAAYGTIATPQRFWAEWKSRFRSPSMSLAESSAASPPRRTCSFPGSSSPRTCST